MGRGARGSWCRRHGTPHTAHRVASHIGSLFSRCWGRTSKRRRRGQGHAAPGGRRVGPPSRPGPWGLLATLGVLGWSRHLSSLCPCCHLAVFPVSVFCVQVNFSGRRSAQVRTTPGFLGCMGLFGSPRYGVGGGGGPCCQCALPRQLACEGSHTPTRPRLCLGLCSAPCPPLPGCSLRRGAAALGSCSLLSRWSRACLRGLRSTRTSPRPCCLLGSAQPSWCPLFARTISQTRGAGGRAAPLRFCVNVIIAPELPPPPPPLQPWRLNRKVKRVPLP